MLDASSMASPKQTKARPLLPISLALLYFLLSSSSASLDLDGAARQLKALMELKASLDPQGTFLPSWNGTGDPCSPEKFEGVACDGEGKVVNVSLQGRGLRGSISPAVAELTSLAGLFLHYNELHGEIPREIGRLSELSELYLNVNNLSGRIPAEIGGLAGLQVLQLSHNKLAGSIPSEVGLMRKLSVLALQSNLITGLIPESLGDLPHITRLDLSSNRLGGAIPGKLARLPRLALLDVTNNSLFGPVPAELGSLEGGFLYANNSGLCGTGFPSLALCGPANLSGTSKPEAYTANISDQRQRDIPQSADVASNCSDAISCPGASRASTIHIAVTAVSVAVGVACSGIVLLLWHRRRRRKCIRTLESTDVMLNSELVKNAHRKSWSPLISLEYSKGWDPLSEGRSGAGFSQEESQSLRLNVEEVEFATQCFAEINLLGRSNFSATYKGILRDGSVVAVKCISKISCKSEEAKFLKGLKVLTSLRHENLVGVRGFCCSKGRGECFLVHDFAANGSLSKYLDSRGSMNDGCCFLDWQRRVSILKGISKGIEYLHSSRPDKPPLVHQNISAKNILIDHQFRPLISGFGLHKLLTDDVIFSSLKSSAAMGYLAPEYTSTGQFTEKSDIYAFGVVIFQVLAGKQGAARLRLGIEQSTLDQIVDQDLHGKFLETEAAKLVSIALACTNESPEERPCIGDIVQELCGDEQV